MGEQPTPQGDTGSRVLDTIAEISIVASNIATRYGHPNVATAIQQDTALAPVFYSIFDVIINLVKHHKATSN